MMNQSENPNAEEYNPFRAPKNPFDASQRAGTSKEAIRRAHLSHEASVKSIGTLYLIGGFLLMVGSIGLIFAIEGRVGGTVGSE
ncbi:MAG: hypothetical protein ABGZ23_13730 [Fuerstiella sp.]